MLHVIAEHCDARVLIETIVRKIHELKDNSLRELIDSENTGKHLRLFYNYSSLT